MFTFVLQVVLKKVNRKEKDRMKKTNKNVLGLQEKFLTKYEKTEVRKKHVKSIKMDNHSVKKWIKKWIIIQ